MMNFDERPILVFWESTRACLLACKHCRAEAVEKPAPGEISTSQALEFIESLTSFGRPYPVLIFTGGDFLMRSDVFLLARRARELGIPFGMSPSVTPKLTDERIAEMKEVGVKAVSISMDGATAKTHDGIRGIPGHFLQTVNMLRKLVEAGFEVQVNTAVMQENVAELPGVVQILKETGVRIWEVFFLIQVGRGRGASELSAAEHEDVCHFLFEASTYDLTVRTVEAPFFRRIVSWRKARWQKESADAPAQAEMETRHGGQSHVWDSLPEPEGGYQVGPLYEQLSAELESRLGPATSAPRAQTSGTRDGKGIIFVAYDGTVYPAGFLPLPLGNIMERPLAEIYRDHPILLDIRATRFKGRCGLCDYRDMCGGSRSRAYMKTMDPLAEDPACPYGLP